jgi:hypothetical protein
MACDKTPGELMVAIFALIGESLLQARRQMSSGATLGLCETMSRCAEFVWMRNLLAGRERQEMQKAGINTYRSCAIHRNTLRLCINAQAQIPARGTLDNTATLPAVQGGWLACGIAQHRDLAHGCMSR